MWSGEECEGEGFGEVELDGSEDVKPGDHGNKRSCLGCLCNWVGVAKLNPIISCLSILSYLCGQSSVLMCPHDQVHAFIPHRV